MAKFQTLSNDLYTIPKAQILFKPAGEDTYEVLGDADDVSLEMNVEETERYTNEEGIRKLAKTIVTQIDPTIALTLVHFSDRNRALALLGELVYKTQAAAPGEVFSVAAVEAEGKLYKLPHVRVANVTVESDDMVPVPYVLNVNYRLDTEDGLVQIVSKPVGAGAGVDVTYDATAIIAGDKIAEIKVGNAPENRGALIIRGTNDVGKQVALHLHDVQLRPSGSRAYISESDLATIELEGRVFTDDTQAPGYELGYEIALN